MSDDNVWRARIEAIEDATQQQLSRLDQLPDLTQREGEEIVNDVRAAITKILNVATGWVGQ